MKPDTWMPVYVGDYLKDTMHLTTLEHGAYWLLLLHGWQHGGRLPADDKQLARIASLSGKQWSHFRATIRGFFSLDPTGKWLVQKRQMAELERAMENQRKAREHSVLGGRANRAKWESRRASRAAIRADTPGIAPSPSPTNKKQEAGPPPALPRPADPAEAQFGPADPEKPRGNLVDSWRRQMAEKKAGKDTP